MAKNHDIALMAHLMRRAGFSASRDELEERVAKGYEATVEDLINPERHPPVDPYTLLRYQPAALLPGGVPPMGGVERREPHQAMDSALGLEGAVRVLALHRDGCRLEAGLLPGARLEHLRLEPPIGRPTQVHAQKHFSPVLRFSAAGSGVNSANRIARVIFSGEQHLSFGDRAQMAPEI